MPMVKQADEHPHNIRRSSIRVGRVNKPDCDNTLVVILQGA